MMGSPGDRGTGGHLGRSFSSPRRFMRLAGCCVLGTLLYFTARISGLGRLLLLEVRKKVRGVLELPLLTSVFLSRVWLLESFSLLLD